MLPVEDALDAGWICLRRRDYQQALSCLEIAESLSHSHVSEIDWILAFRIELAKGLLDSQQYEAVIDVDDVSVFRLLKSPSYGAAHDQTLESYLRLYQSHVAMNTLDEAVRVLEGVFRKISKPTFERIGAAGKVVESCLSLYSKLLEAHKTEQAVRLKHSLSDWTSTTIPSDSLEKVFERIRHETSGEKASDRQHALDKTKVSGLQSDYKVDHTAVIATIESSSQEEQKKDQKYVEEIMLDGPEQEARNATQAREQAEQQEEDLDAHSMSLLDLLQDDFDKPERCRQAFNPAGSKVRFEQEHLLTEQSSNHDNTSLARNKGLDLDKKLEIKAPHHTNSSPSTQPNLDLDGWEYTSHSETEQARTWDKGITGEDERDRYFHDVEHLVYPFMYDKYRNCGVGSSQPYQRIKVAILDTGLARTKKGGRPDFVRAHNLCIKECASFCGPGTAGDEDEDGHGTHVAMLVLRICPNAELYIARVAKKGNSIKKAPVIAGLQWAAGKGVDIVNMSFGWPHTDTQDLENALKDVSDQGILLFAATSNDGHRYPVGMSYPAISSYVIGIDSCSAVGVSSKHLNPQSNARNNRKWRFKAPGEDVRSAYPTTLEPTGWKRLEGTSYATPIACGIAALVLEFARQPPLGLEPKVFNTLKNRDAMLEVFHELLSEENSPEPLRFLYPWLLFHAEKLEDGTTGGGDAYEIGSPRLGVATKIVDCLRQRYGADVRDVYKKIRNRAEPDSDSTSTPT